MPDDKPITFAKGRGRRPKGSKMPLVHKPAHTPIRKSYFEEFNERNKELKLETEAEMRKRLFDE